MTTIYISPALIKQFGLVYVQLEVGEFEAAYWETCLNGYWLIIISVFSPTF